MFRQEAERTEGLPIEVMLTPEHVAEEILGMAPEDKRDLTLAPNPDIALLIERTKDVPDRTEDDAVKAYYHRMRSQEQT